MKPKLQQLTYKCTSCGYTKEIYTDFMHVYKEVKCPECNKVLKSEEDNNTDSD
jgi:DNA-directed RNA polymerase subunit RPC12/RpoP